MPPKEVDEKVDRCRSEDDIWIELDVKKCLTERSNRILSQTEGVYLQ